MTGWTRLVEWGSQIVQRGKAALRREPVAMTLLAGLVVAGAVLRLYRLPQTLMFQGDQGRDALVVAAIFREWDPVLIGPVTSVGNMYLGPFYYYFMLPFLWLSYPSPVGPAVGVALVNILGIAGLCWGGQRLVGKPAALWASFFFTFSQVAIYHARFSWNPNLSAVFSLVVLVCIHQAYHRSPRYWLGVGLAAGLLIQLHYVNLIMVAVAGLFWLAQAVTRGRDRAWRRREKFGTYSLLAGAIFVATLTPLIIFDARHGWRNVQAMSSIFTTESSFTADGNGLTTLELGLKEIPGRLAHLFGTLTFPMGEEKFSFLPDLFYWRVGLAVIMVGMLLWLAIRAERSGQWPATERTGVRLLIVSTLAAGIALGFYRHSVYDHYVLFFYPVLFLTLGWLLHHLAAWPRVYAGVGTLVVATYLYLNYQPGFFQELDTSPRHLQQTANQIAAHLPEDETYSLVLFSENKDYYGYNYRYFTKVQRPRLLPPELNSQAQHLFVIDEQGESDIFGSGIYELATYPTNNVSEIFYSPHRQIKIYHLESQHEQ